MVKGACFLIISLLVSSNAVAKETEAFEKLFSFEAGWPGEDPCTAYVVSGDGPLLSGDSRFTLRWAYNSFTLYQEGLFGLFTEGGRL